MDIQWCSTIAAINTKKTAEYKPHFYAKIAGCDTRFL